MATSIRNEGRYIDVNLTVATGVTITAGSMVCADVSGTNILYNVTGLADSTGFLGILTETLTGPHTGVTIATEGVYKLCVEASTTEGFTGIQAAPGIPAYATSGNAVRPWGNTAATLTGLWPVGIIVKLHTAASSVSGAANTGADVKIYPFKQLTVGA